MRAIEAAESLDEMLKELSRIGTGWGNDANSPLVSAATEIYRALEEFHKLVGAEAVSEYKQRPRPAQERR